MSDVMYCEKEQRLPFRMRCVSVYHYDDDAVWRYQFLAHNWAHKNGPRPEFTIEVLQPEYEVGALYRMYFSKEVRT